MFTASNALLIAQADIDSNGNFRIIFPAGSVEKLYRLHFIKNGDPVSTLIIGSKDANHVFFVAAENDKLMYVQENIIEQSNIGGNRATGELNLLLHIVHSDSISHDSLKNKLIEIARTSSELVSLLSIYNEFGLNRKQKETIRGIVKNFNHENAYGGRIFEEYASQVTNPWMWSLPVLVFFITLIIAWRIYKKRYRSKIQQRLSQREIKIARMILDGKSNKEIAMELNIELSTVKTHINNTYSKLKINTRKELRKYNDLLKEQ